MLYLYWGLEIDRSKYPVLSHTMDVSDKLGKKQELILRTMIFFSLGFDRKIWENRLVAFCFKVLRSRNPKAASIDRFPFVRQQIGFNYSDKQKLGQLFCKVGLFVALVDAQLAEVDVKSTKVDEFRRLIFLTHHLAFASEPLVIDVACCVGLHGQRKKIVQMKETKEGIRCKDSIKTSLPEVIERKWRSIGHFYSTPKSQVQEIGTILVSELL